MEVKGDMELVRGLIELILNYHPAGLNVLIGRARPPRGRIVYDMLKALDADNLNLGFKLYNSSFNINLNLAEKIIDANLKLDAAVKAAGGWRNINLASYEYARDTALDWQLIGDYMDLIGNYAVKHSSRLGLLAARYSLSVQEVCDRRASFANRLASKIINNKNNNKNKGAD